MTEFAQHKQEILNYFNTSIAIAQKIGVGEIEQQLGQAADRLTKGLLFVVICGEFKQGKSSLLGAFLNDSECFPVDQDVTTSLVTTISFGEQEKVTVWLGEGKKEVARTINRAEISDYVTERGNPKNHRQVRLLTIETPNEQLKNGLVLVDTPGIGGINIEHTEVTFAFIPNADVILFVSDALAPLTTNELEFLEKRIFPFCSDVLFVVTKIDQVQDTATILASNRDKLSKLMKRPGEDIPFMLVSSQNKLDYLQSGDPEDLEDSGFTELESTLWQLLEERRGQLLLLHALRELSNGLEQIKTPLQMELHACQQANAEELDKLEKELQKAIQRLSDLQEHEAEWRKTLSYGLADIRKNVGHDYERGATDIREKFEQYIQKYIKEPQRILGELVADFQGLSSNLFRNVLVQADSLRSQIETQSAIQLKFRPGEARSLEIREQPNLEGIKPKTRFLLKSLETGRQSFSYAVGGTLSGSVIGGVLGGILGGIGGLFAGGIGAIPGAIAGFQTGMSYGALGGTGIGVGIGTKKGLETVDMCERNEAANEIRKRVTPFINRSLLMCKENLDNAMTPLERAMADEFIEKLTQERKVMERSQSAIKKSRSHSQAQAAQRASELKVPLSEIEQLQKTIERQTEKLTHKDTEPTHFQKEELDYGDFADA